MAWIDITGPIQEGMWNYGPHLPEITIKKIEAIEQGKHDIYAFCLTSLTATYLETAAHYFKGERSIDQLHPEDFILDANIIKLKPKGFQEAILVEELRPYTEKIKPNSALLISTGWEDKWNNPDFVIGSPYFTPEAMQWVVDRKISLLGADIPCYDNQKNSVRVNSLLFKSGALILAPLVNLKNIPKDSAKLYAFPLKIVGVCATPCRALLEL
ncbi:MAG: cyclase family protein [bacterium]|nr:cyclase family protein [bacterium]